MYSVALVLLVPIGLIFLVTKHGWRRTVSDWRERLGVADVRGAGSTSDIRLWFHVASLGELEAARDVLEALKVRHPQGFFCLTTLTPEAKRRALEDRVADEVRLAPIDLPCLVRKVVEGFNPQALILVETELWPNLIRETRKSGRQVMLINGRLSEKSVRRWKLLQPWVRELLSSIHPLFVRTELDKERFIRLGAAPAHVKALGNLKYARAARRPISKRQELLQRLSLDPHQHPVLVAGSTWPGEEKIVVNAAISLKKKWSHLLLILAPRHPQRSGELMRTLQTAGLKTVPRSSCQSSSSPQTMDCLLVDTLGELAEIYALGDAAVMGGSFVQRGGQNPLEPAACGIPVVFGPSMENFRVEADGLLKVGGGFLAQPETLAGELDRLLSNEQIRRTAGGAARHYVDSKLGILDEAVRLIESSTQS